ncbi:GAF domain-containing protein [Crocosphaera sp.]|uniref:GAF domain-containing protein n=1 Tax=Crocosphaera sp. TaxID=2729996 RepID=UPI00261B4FC5|nr:GAF domain-containing protein [Crocosphaera sp.]MDJ0580545.1 GAF domain-containing protein [Crocosphaera sp.]
MVLNWIFDSPEQETEAEQNGYSQENGMIKQPLEDEENGHAENKVEHSEEFKMNRENFAPTEDKETHLATLDANYREMSSVSVVDFDLNDANWLTNINQQTQQRMVDGLDQIRQSLQADRVLIYGFNPDGSGEVLAESVDARWSKAASSFDLDYNLTEDNCKPYYVVNDISTKGFALCLVEALQALEAKAYIVVPIKYNDQLLGVLGAYQNATPRNWQESDLKLMLNGAAKFRIPLQQTAFIRNSQFQQKQRDKAVKQERALGKMLEQIRNAKEDERIFQIATYEGRKLLQADRLAVYRFDEDWGGRFIAESVGPGWSKLIDTILVVNDTFLQENQGGRYKHGECFAVDDIYGVGHQACHIALLEQFEARAYAIAPIFIGDMATDKKLWGLLGVYQNSGCRKWQKDEIELLRQLGLQIGIGIQQNQQFAELQKTVFRQKSVAQMVARMQKADSVENALEIAAQETRKLLEVERSSIYRFNADWSGENVVEAPFDQEFKALQDSCFQTTFSQNCYPYLQDSQGGSYKNGQACIVNDLSQSGLEERLIEILERLDVNAFVRMPIFVDQKLWGIINLYQSKTRLWKEDDLEFLQRMIQQISGVIQQKQYLDELQTQAQQEEAIANIVQRINASLNVQDIFRSATQEIRNLLQVDRAVVYRFNLDWSGEVLAESAGAEWVSVMEIQETDETLFSKEMNAHEQCTLKNMQAGSALDRDTYFINTKGGDYTRGKQFNVVNDIYNAGFSSCYLRSLEKYQAKAYMIVPIFQNNQLWGLFAVYQNSGTRRWKSSELNLMLKIAPQLGIAIEQAELLETIQSNNKELKERSQRESAMVQFSSRLMGRFAQLMQKNNNPKKLMEFAIKELRQVLKVDRVAIYSFASDWSGKFIIESVSPNWPKLVGTELAEVKDSRIQEDQGGRYLRQESLQVNDIYQSEDHDLPFSLLEETQTKAYLLVPIFNGEQLWGLLGVYQNDRPRQWEQSEQAILEQVAINLGVTLKVGEYVTQLRSQEEQLSELVEKERNQREGLQQGALRVLLALEPSFSGDLTVRAPISEDEIGTIADGYNTTIQSMRELVRQVQVSASRVSDTSSLNSNLVNQLSEKAHLQVEQLKEALMQLELMVSSTEDVAACAKKVEQTVEETNQTVQSGDSLMEKTVDEILEIRSTVSDTAKKIKRLGETFQKITKVVNLIENFATQTNLLALNASIEATRAGEAGKGFSVVADEVRSLAYQSANATTEITRLVDEIRTGTNDVTEAMEIGLAQVVNGTNLVRETQQSLSAIVTATNNIKELVGEITETSANQTQQFQIVTKVMANVSAISEETSQETAQISDSFKELEDTSSELQTNIRQFKVD